MEKVISISKDGKRRQVIVYSNGSSKTQHQIKTPDGWKSRPPATEENVNDLIAKAASALLSMRR